MSEEKLLKKQQKRETKMQKKALKAQEKKEKKEIEEAFMHDRLVDKDIEKDINDKKRQAYIEKMTPTWEEWKRLNEAPKLSVLEEIGNAVSHGIGAALTIVALILLLQKSDTTLKMVGAIVYCVAMFFMFFNSCLYHSWRWGIKVKRIWRRFDYTSIYFMIAGTFAPLQLVEIPRDFSGDAGYIFGITYFCVMWALVITGVTLTCIFGPGRTKKINFPLYFIIGWSGLCVVPSWLSHNIALFWWILIGGIVYTLGMIPFALLKGKKSAHFIWHLIVMAGVIIQFMGIYLCVY